MCAAWLHDIQQAKEVVLTALPLYHSYGMTTCMNLSVYAAAAILLIPNPRDIPDLMKNINKHHPTLFPGVPTMYVAFNNFPDIGKYNVRSIRACMSGAAGLPVEVQKKFQELTGGRLVEGFGLSEASPVTHANPVFGNNKIGTIGMPWPDTESKIMDLETGTKEMPMGEIGELIIRGPQVMKGYWNMPKETEIALRNGWLYTGDIAKMDEEGYFQIVDRKKDMIIAGGYNIYPRDVEEVLYQHPKVKEAVVAGIPDPYRGETVKAYIILKEGQTATPEEIIAFCKERIAKYKVPTAVEFRTQLPKTIIGKILRRMLVDEEKKKMAAKG
jgi:long-chain acyl-CoA synthetase